MEASYLSIVRELIVKKATTTKCGTGDWWELRTIPSYLIFINSIIGVLFRRIGVEGISEYYLQVV
jgi:hypothetical protein